MKWLENTKDETETVLAQALNVARQRTGDEVARRRIWARIEDLPLGQAVPVKRPRSFAVPVLTGALVAVGVVAVLWLIPGLRPGQPSVAVTPIQPVVPPSTQPQVVSPQIDSKGQPTPVRTGRGQKAKVALVGGAGVELDANSVLSWDTEHRPLVESGHARFEVPHQAPGNRFAVSAGPYVITVVGTKFHVGVVENRVSVDVEEGVVEVWRGSRSVRLVEGDSWAGSMRGSSPSAIERRSSQALPRRAAPAASAPSVADKSSAIAELAEARAELSEGHSEEALAILARCAKGTGPAAENATYEMGRVLRDRLHRPRAAIGAWSQYRSRFPGGLLRAETDLSLLETLASLGEKSRALAEAEAFLARYPNSERRDEVAKLAARLRGATEGP